MGRNMVTWFFGIVSGDFSGGVQQYECSDHREVCATKQLLDFDLAPLYRGNDVVVSQSSETISAVKEAKSSSLALHLFYARPVGISSR